MFIILPFLYILTKPCFFRISIFSSDIFFVDDSIGHNNKSFDFGSFFTTMSTTSDVESFFTTLFDFGEYVIPIRANNSFR